MNLATRSLFALFAALPLSVACGGSDSGDASEPAATTQAPEFKGVPNGKQITETQACARVREATLKDCTLTVATCPSLLRTAYELGDPKLNCSTWDEGVVASCEDYMASLTCAQRVTYPCKLIYFKNTGTGAEVCEGAGGAGGGGGSSGAAGVAGASAGTAGASGGTAGASGGTAGASGGTAGASGGTAGTGGGTAGTGGATAGTGGASGGASGASAGSAGTSGGSSAGAAGASAGSAGSN